MWERVVGVSGSIFLGFGVLTFSYASVDSKTVRDQVSPESKSDDHFALRGPRRPTWVFPKIKVPHLYPK